MTLQQTVRLSQGFGIIGEIIKDGPLRAQPYQINPAAPAADCVIGRMFSLVIATNMVVPGTGGASPIQGTNTLAGILANPKTYALQGTVAGGSLAPTLNVLPGTVGEFVEMGFLVVSLAGPAVVGDSIQYDFVTGVLSPIRGAAAAGHALVPGARVDRVIETNAVATLVVAELMGLQ